MTQHFEAGHNLEQVLETVDDAMERARLINEAYVMLGRVSVELGDD